MSTNCTAWLRSITVCDVISEIRQEPDVHQHRPDRGMRDRVQPLEPSAYGLSRAAPIGPFSTKLWVIQPERAKEGSRSVDPHQESAEPGQSAGLRCTFPVDAADDRRHELHRCRERNEPDRHQRVGLADKADIGIAEQHHEIIVARRIISRMLARSRRSTDASGRHAEAAA